MSCTVSFSTLFLLFFLVCSFFSIRSALRFLRIFCKCTSECRCLFVATCVHSAKQLEMYIDYFFDDFLIARVFCSQFLKCTASAGQFVTMTDVTACSFVSTMTTNGMATQTLLSWCACEFKCVGLNEDTFGYIEQSELELQFTKKYYLIYLSLHCT